MLNSFKNEYWEQSDQATLASEGARRAANKLNSIDYDRLVAELRQSIVESENPGDVDFAWIKSKKSSKTDAIVTFNPFGNGLTDSMLLRAEFIRLAAEYNGITDEDGDPLSIFVIPAPTADNIPWLSVNAQGELREGNLKGLAEKLMRGVTHSDIGRVAMTGFSFGADMAVAGSISDALLNIDLIGVSVGDPVRVRRRTRAQLMTDFALRTSMKDVKNAAADSQIDPIIKSVGVADGFVGTVLNRINRVDIAKALGQPRFNDDLEDLLLADNWVDGINITVGYGSRSSITNPIDIRRQLGSVAGLHNLSKYGRPLPIRLIEVEGAKHSWGDNPKLLYELYSRGISTVYSGPDTVS